MMESSRSPIKDKPLRTPGQSLEEQRRALIDDRFETWGLVAAFFVVMALVEWFRYFRPLPPQPWLLTACAVAMGGFAAWRLWRIWPRLLALRQGIEGEKAVGQFLERLRSQGYQVFHDVMGEGFNVDHVLIGPAGVFTIETKTWSKPARGDARIVYDGAGVSAAGRKPDRDPLLQARSQARWLGQLLAESTGKPLAVRPVVMFPGWYVEAAPGSQHEVWVMEPKGLPAFLAREQVRLQQQDVKLASFHLSRFIRSAERDRVAA